MYFHGFDDFRGKQQDLSQLIGNLKYIDKTVQKHKRIFEEQSEPHAIQTIFN